MGGLEFSLGHDGEMLKSLQQQEEAAWVYIRKVTLHSVDGRLGVETTDREVETGDRSLWQLKMRVWTKAVRMESGDKRQ